MDARRSRHPGPSVFSVFSVVKTAALARRGAPGQPLAYRKNRLTICSRCVLPLRVATPDDIRAHRVARLERLANVGEAFVSRLYHFAEGWSDAAAVRDCSAVAHLIIRDIQLGVLLQMKIENGWTERAEPETDTPAPPRGPGADVCPSEPRLRLPELKLPKIPADFEAGCERHLADAAVIVGQPGDDPYVRPNFPALIARAHKAHRAVLQGRAHGPAWAAQAARAPTDTS